MAPAAPAGHPPDAAARTFSHPAHVFAPRATTCRATHREADENARGSNPLAPAAPAGHPPDAAPAARFRTPHDDLPSDAPERWPRRAREQSVSTSTPRRTPTRRCRACFRVPHTLSRPRATTCRTTHREAGQDTRGSNPLAQQAPPDTHPALPRTFSRPARRLAGQRAGRLAKTCARRLTAAAGLASAALRRARFRVPRTFRTAHDDLPGDTLEEPRNRAWEQSVSRSRRHQAPARRNAAQVFAPRTLSRLARRLAAQHTGRSRRRARGHSVSRSRRHRALARRSAAHVFAPRATTCRATRRKAGETCARRPNCRAGLACAALRRARFRTARDDLPGDTPEGSRRRARGRAPFTPAAPAGARIRCCAARNLACRAESRVERGISRATRHLARPDDATGGGRGAGPLGGGYVVVAEFALVELAVGVAGEFGEVVD